MAPPSFQAPVPVPASNDSQQVRQPSQMPSISVPTVPPTSAFSMGAAPDRPLPHSTQTATSSPIPVISIPSFGPAPTPMPAPTPAAAPAEERKVSPRRQAPAKAGDGAKGGAVAGVNRDALSKALQSNPLGPFPKGKAASNAASETEPEPLPKNFAHQVHLTLKKGAVDAQPFALPGIGQGPQALAKRGAKVPPPVPAPIPAELSVPFQSPSQHSSQPTPVPVAVPMSMPIETYEVVADPIPVPVEMITIESDPFTMYSVPQIETESPVSFAPSQHRNVKRPQTRDDLQSQLMSGLIYNGTTYKPEKDLSQSDVESALKDLEIN